AAAVDAILAKVKDPLLLDTTLRESEAVHVPGFRQDRVLGRRGRRKEDLGGVSQRAGRQGGAKLLGRLLCVRRAPGRLLALAREPDPWGRPPGRESRGLEGLRGGWPRRAGRD